jgi:hypothetical protein
LRCKQTHTPAIHVVTVTRNSRLGLPLPTTPVSGTFHLGRYDAYHVRLLPAPIQFVQLPMSVPTGPPPPYPASRSPPDQAPTPATRYSGGGVSPGGWQPGLHSIPDERAEAYDDQYRPTDWQPELQPPPSSMSAIFRLFSHFINVSAFGSLLFYRT